MWLDSRNFMFANSKQSMVDKLSPEQRRKCMQANKSNDTKPELIVRKYLFSQGIHYRLHCSNLPGKPDIVLKKYSTVIFINGCFWHGHEACPYYRLPKTNTLFWKNKIETNRERDENVRQQLISLGWGVMVIWECQLKPSVREATLKEVVYNLSVAYLKKCGVRTTREIYAPKEDDIAIAAEDYTPYGKEHNE